MLVTKPAFYWDLLWLDERDKNYEYVDWRTHFADVENIHKVNYCLSIIDSFTTRDTTHLNMQAYDTWHLQSWLSRFLEQGGFNMLSSVLESLLNRPGIDDLTAKTVENLLRLVMIFVLGAVEADMTPEECEEARRRKVVSKPSSEPREIPLDDAGMPLEKSRVGDAPSPLVTHTSVSTGDEDVRTFIGPLPADAIVTGSTLPVNASEITQEHIFGPQTES